MSPYQPIADDITQFNVLYYKRTNKVHKAKGVSKFDGILSVEIKTGTVKLHSLENEDVKAISSSPDIVNKSCRWIDGKKQERHSHQKNNLIQSVTSILYSGINKDIAKRAEDFTLEDVVVVGSYNVEIVDCISCDALTHISKERSNNPLPCKQNVRKSPFASNSMNAIQSNARSFTRTVIKNNLQENRNDLTKNTEVEKDISNVDTIIQDENEYEKSTHASMPKKSVKRDWKSTSFRSTNEPFKMNPKPVMNSMSRKNYKSDTLLKNITSNTIKNIPTKQVSCMSKSCKITKTVPIAHKFDDGKTRPSSVLPNIPLLASIRNVLQPHQVEGVEFLWNALVQSEEPHKGALLCDEMGLGKTLMTVAVIVAMYRQQRDRKFIVVCPSSLVCNWAAEFDKWVGRASEPKCVVVNKGGEDCTQLLKAFRQNSVKIQPMVKSQGQVLIISYDLLRRYIDLFRFDQKCIDSRPTTTFGLLVVDEGHRLKNTKGTLTLTALESIPTNARLCITATPIQNNLSEFYTIANFTKPGILGSLSDFRRIFDHPISISNSKSATPEQRNTGFQKTEELLHITKNFMIRRTQKDILKHMLHPRTEMLLFCQASLTQKDMYKIVARKAQDGRNGDDALTALTNLRKICLHPWAYQENTSNQVNKHNSQSNCNDNYKHLEAVALSGKLVVLKSLLTNLRDSSPDDKVVIVSNFTSALSMIEKIMSALNDNSEKKNKFSFLRLDGTTSSTNRQHVVKTFNTTSADHHFCLLLSAKAGGCGLNLVRANRLILFEPDWNPATDIQAMGRIYRQGQLKPCFIYRLFTSGTVEEVMYQRQYQKGDLATLAVDGGKTNGYKSGVGLSFSKEELADCFTIKENCLCDTKEKIGNHWPTYDLENCRDFFSQQDCTDEVILNVALETANTLSYVHLISDHEASTSVPNKEFQTQDEFEPCCDANSFVNENDTSSIKSSTSEEEFDL